MWENVEIVMLEQAKAHARITDKAEDPDLTLKLEDAHAIVLDYLARNDADWMATMQAWTDETAPKAIRAAILRQFMDLVRFRGDDDDASAGRVDGNDLSPRVKQLLKKYRDPALA